MRLVNVKKGNGIIGLMFKQKIDLLYAFRLGVIDKTLHTFFCFSDMDAIGLNECGRVSQKLHMTPWKTYTCNRDVVNVVEGWVGAFEDVKVGDLVEF
jgi:uncharacterized membrane protein (UPF0127 family)